LSFSRYDFSEAGSLVIKGKAKNSCNYVEESATILADGSVVPCCYDFNARRVMGNISNESLREIWHNKKYHLFRCQIKEDREKIELCATCQEGREMFIGEKKAVGDK
jgi:radical SAM protein with 4Fe4S-binding SPASM domain